MTERRGNPIYVLWNSSRAQLSCGVLLLIVMAGWLLPRPSERLSTVGGDRIWLADSAPSVREIVWQTPEELLDLRTQDEAVLPLVTPHLTDNGATVYFSRRMPDGSMDIFRSRLIDGVWGTALPVDALNSEFDELGAELSHDGRKLYFYSNRPGGAGGTDIYVSQRNGNGWSTPENLGDSVNSPADEYDPSPGLDDASLYFTSNRNNDPLPNQRAVAGEARPWTTTLRAQQDRVTFDLYVAQRDSSDEPWNAAAPLTALNEPNSSEGAAMVSPDGAFLYFASDRHARDGEPANLDIYRARLLDNSIGRPQNLGIGINTAADETEPSLSPEGFTLVFSSNRDGIDQLYESRAKEIVRTTTWDTSHLAPFRHSWVLVAAFLTALLLALLVWQRRRVWDSVWPARFFLGSVLINFVLLLLLAAWKFPEVLEAVAKTFEDSVPAPQMLDENEHQSHEDGREAYEKVADLKSVDAQAIPEVVRQVTEATSMPERTERLAPTISADVARTLPAERVLFVPPKEVVVRTTQTDSPFERRRPARQPEMTAAADLPDVELPSEAMPDEQNPATQATVAPVETTMSDPVPTTKTATAAETSATANPVELATVTPSPESLPETASVPDQPFRRRPLTTTQSVLAASDPTLPDLPAGSDAASDSPTESATVKVQRTAAPDNLLSPTSLAPATLPNSPVRARQLNTLPTAIAAAAPTPTVRTIDSPLQSRIRKPRVTTAVASLDTELPEVAAAIDIPTEQTVDGRRPEPTRSSATTLPAAAPLTVSTLQTTEPSRPTQFTPVESAAQPNMDIAITALPTAPLSRRRPMGRKSAPLLVAELDVDAALIADDIPNPQATNVDSATASVQKTPVAERDSPVTQPALASSVASLPMPAATQRQPATPNRPRQTNSIPVVAALPTNPLLRRRRDVTQNEASSAVDDSFDQLEPMEAGVPQEAQNVAATDSAVDRTIELSASIDVPTPRELTGPATLVSNRIVVGELSEKLNNAPPAFSPIASRLSRKRARAMKVALAEDNVGLQALFTLRQGDTRRQHIKLLGGSDESEKAVNMGLDWFAKSQEEDGSWNLQKHNGSTKSFTAGTGLGLLPFLAAGYTHNQTGKYQEVVAHAVKRLVENQKETGELTSDGDAQRMYTHGIAAIALCEAFAMSQDQELREPAQKALAFIVSAQHKPSGGWRYNPNESADTSVVGWQMMALKSGEMAGLTVPTESYALVRKWLDSVEAKSGPGGSFGYVNRGASPAMTAEGLLCLQFMGDRRNSPKMRFGADYVLRSLPEENQRHTSYYWYYATQVMYHMQGEYWDTWNEKTRDLLVKTQQKSGATAGTWNPRDRWEKSGGRVYTTAIKLLMLEVYYRHLPLYDQLEF